MTFSCQYYEDKTEACLRLKGKCILGRKGCILEGKIKMDESQIKRIQKLNKDSNKND